MHFGHALHATHHISTTKLEDCENPDIHEDLEPYHNEDVCHFFNDHDADGSGGLSVDEAVDGIIAEVKPHLEHEISHFIHEHGSEHEESGEMEVTYEEFLEAIKHYETANEETANE